MKRMKRCPSQLYSLFCPLLSYRVDNTLLNPVATLAPWFLVIGAGFLFREALQAITRSLLPMLVLIAAGPAVAVDPCHHQAVEDTPEPDELAALITRRSGERSVI